MTPDDLRKLADRLTDPMTSVRYSAATMGISVLGNEAAEVLRACADVVEYAKETVTTHPVKAYKGHQKMIEALARLEALK